MYRCSKCPAVFTKVNTLIYHMTLHDQKSPFNCDSCTYSANSEDNLSIHSLLHNLTESQTALGYNFNYREIWHTTRDLYNMSISEYMEYTSVTQAVTVYNMANLRQLMPRDQIYEEEKR